ncbi:hypothetical protein SRHO_G00209810 [Serrasalmus rhombeus]
MDRMQHVVREMPLWLHERPQKSLEPSVSLECAPVWRPTVTAAQLSRWAGLKPGLGAPGHVQLTVTSFQSYFGMCREVRDAAADWTRGSGVRRLSAASPVHHGAPVERHEEDLTAPTGAHGGEEHLHGEEETKHCSQGGRTLGNMGLGQI